jgi:hypothetical protein
MLDQYKRLAQGKDDRIGYLGELADLSSRSVMKTVCANGS